MDQVSDEEVEVREEEEEEEEDSDKEDQDLDKMFGAWLGELDKLTQSLDDGRPEQPPQQKAPLRQETNMANFSYRFSIYNINEALNQGENVDLDALMADLCSIEQELSTINNKPNSAGGMARLGLTDTKVRQKPPAGRSSRQQPAGSSSGGGGGGGSSNNSRTVSYSTRHSQIMATTLSLLSSKDNALTTWSTEHTEGQASLSMDEAARQTSSHSLSSASSYTSATMRRPGSSQRQHRRTGSVGTVSEHEARSIVHSSRSSVTSASGVSVNSASSMDSLDSVLRSNDSDSQQSSVPPSAGASQAHHNTEHSYLDRETSLILRNIAGKPSHLLTKRRGDSLQHRIHTARAHTLTAVGWQSAVLFGVLGFGCLCNGSTWTHKSVASPPRFISLSQVGQKGIGRARSFHFDLPASRGTSQSLSQRSLNQTVSCSVTRQSVRLLLIGDSRPFVRRELKNHDGGRETDSPTGETG
ncbi:Ras-associated and pleckstrin homology domains-containing protein 1 [Larimichthys crocea]|uniref:Uncharacterized protein n=1 Tax=Larimichthys crocea TaxID=215358 RepID=A0ACD3QHQ5_LARCR|nr:Ras-associated and pleckstrin homology domains-containing protein 1 [Larimichthys crocea]